MTLNDYIKMSYERPNRKILEGLGASESLIEYLMETPGNTNWNIIDSITNSSGGGDAEVWLVGDTYMDEDGARIFSPTNSGSTDHMTELYANGGNYQVFSNGLELTNYYSATHAWMDGETEMTSTALFILDDATTSTLIYVDATTAPTSVEVSVKAK